MERKIVSKDNEKVKYWKKLSFKKYRDTSDSFLVYGHDLVELALKKGVVRELITSNPQKKGILVTKAIMEHISQSETAFDIAAVCIKKDNQINSKRILVLDGIQDPTNVGTLLRSALAFNFRHVILSNECADIYNDKVIRASRGSFLDLNIERTNLEESLMLLKNQGFFIIGAEAHGQRNQLEKKEQTVLVLGNERSGISESVLSLIDTSYQIKTNNVESLNVSVAGAILMYELKDYE